MQGQQNRINTGINPIVKSSDQNSNLEEINLYKITVDPRSNSLLSYKQLGERFTHLNCWESAARVYKQAIEKSPSSAELQHRLGYVLEAQGQLDKAITCYKRSIEIDPECSIAYLCLKNALKKQGRFDEVTAWDRRQIYQKVLQSHSENCFEDEAITQQSDQVDFDVHIHPLQSYLGGLKYSPVTWNEISGKRIHIMDGSGLDISTGLSAPEQQILYSTESFHIDIIICVHNALDDVKVCLSSILDCTTVDYRLVIIDDGSEEETTQFLREWIDQHSSVMLIRNKVALGYTRAANQGLVLSSGKFSILLNSDTIVTSQWVEKLIECAASDPQIAVVGPLSNCASWQSVPELFDQTGDWLVNTIPEGYSIDQFSQLIEKLSEKVFPQVSFINGFCYMIRNSVLNDIGLLDEENFPYGYGEENDFSLRVKKAGFKLAIADHTYIYHAKSKSFGHQRRKELSQEGCTVLKLKYPEIDIEALTNEIKHHQCLDHLRIKLKKEFQKSVDL